ncbi:transcription antitermination factor NusB [Pueribacillus sp. YX66]|uniref:transcription antitermination factor NusB n=1 Tax=Pueribacillus sp. YX66 TaxID=3229242 RepID=UPI00358D981D
MNRRTAREKTIQVLFQYDVSNIDVQEAKEYVLDDGRTDPFFERLVSGTMTQLNKIDELIKKHLEKWSFERIANVDRAILRLAVYELLYEEEIPVSVTVNEAVELAKTFGGEDSNRFINGVLSKIMEEEK